MCGMQFERPLEGDDVVCGAVARRVWTRVDKGRRCFQTSNKHGPPWSAVVCRRTLDLQTGALVQCDWVRQKPPNFDWHATLPAWVGSIRTELEYEIEEQCRSVCCVVQGFPWVKQTIALVGCVSTVPILDQDVKDESEDGGAFEKLEMTTVKRCEKQLMVLKVFLLLVKQEVLDVFSVMLEAGRFSLMRLVGGTTCSQMQTGSGEVALLADQEERRAQYNMEKSGFSLMRLVGGVTCSRMQTSCGDAPLRSE
eukprot:3019286-Amphidinium_carterae.1